MRHIFARSNIHHGVDAVAQQSGGCIHPRTRTHHDVGARLAQRCAIVWTHAAGMLDFQEQLAGVSVESHRASRLESRRSNAGAQHAVWNGPLTASVFHRGSTSTSGKTPLLLFAVGWLASATRKRRNRSNAAGGPDNVWCVGAFCTASTTSGSPLRAMSCVGFRGKQPAHRRHGTGHTSRLRHAAFAANDEGACATAQSSMRPPGAGPCVQNAAGCLAVRHGHPRRPPQRTPTPQVPPPNVLRQTEGAAGIG